MIFPHKKTKLHVPFPEPKNLVDYGTLEGKTEGRCWSCNWRAIWRLPEGQDILRSRRGDCNNLSVDGGTTWLEMVGPLVHEAQRPDPQQRDGKLQNTSGIRFRRHRGEYEGRCGILRDRLGDQQWLLDMK